MLVKAWQALQGLLGCGFWAKVWASSFFGSDWPQTIPRMGAELKPPRRPWKLSVWLEPGTGPCTGPTGLQVSPKRFGLWKATYGVVPFCPFEQRHWNRLLQTDLCKIGVYRIRVEPGGGSGWIEAAMQWAKVSSAHVGVKPSVVPLPRGLMDAECCFWTAWTRRAKARSSVDHLALSP